MHKEEEKFGRLFSGTVTNRLGDRFDRVAQVGILLHILLDIFDGVYYCRVIAVAEFLADRGKCHLCDLMHQIDRDLPRIGNLLRTLLLSLQLFHKGLATEEHLDILGSRRAMRRSQT